MHSLAMVCQKGGAGKTTLAVHLAIEAHRRGFKTLLIDVDQQGSAAKILERRGDEPPDVATEHPARLEASMRAAEQEGYDVVILDTAPQADQAAIKAARVANTILIPVRPSIVDLDAIDATMDVCRLVQNPGLFVLNAVSAQGLEADGAERAIVARGGKICDVRIGDRKVFRAAFNDGRAAQEIDANSKAASEIRRLFDRLPFPAAPMHDAVNASSRAAVKASR